MIPPLVGLSVDYYRNPLAYGHLADGGFPLPRGFTQQFSDLCSALSPLHIGATALALDSSPEELEAAARFFARHVLLDPSATHYRSLGVSPRASRTVIREHYIFLIRLFHPDRLPNATAMDLACSRRLNSAYHVLADPERRARYDREHLGSKRRIRYSDPRDFFGPHQVPLAAKDAPPHPTLTPKRWVWGTGLVMACGALTLGGVALWHATPAPLMRAAPIQDAPPPEARPYYLRGAETPEQTAAGSAPPASAADMPIAMPMGGDKAATADVSSGAATIGTRVASELQIAFRRGDTAKLGELFADPLPDALFQAFGLRPPGDSSPTDSGDKVWLTLTDMVWQHGADGEISGHGTAIVAEQDGASPGAKEFRRTVELELAPVKSRYRIRHLHFRND